VVLHNHKQQVKIYF